MNGKSASIYYRLKIVDVKEQYKYSDTIAFSSLTSGIYANVSAQQNKLKITIPENWSGKTVYYSIYNASNKIIRWEKMRVNWTRIGGSGNFGIRFETDDAKIACVF